MTDYYGLLVVSDVVGQVLLSHMEGVTICKRRKTDIPRFKGARISMAINFGKKGMPNTNIRKSERITPV